MSSAKRDTWMIGTETLTVEQVAEARRNGLTYDVVYQRMIGGKQPADKAVSKPKHIKRKHKHYPEIDFVIAEENGISRDLYRKRRKLGWTREKARTYQVRPKQTKENVG